MVTPKQDSTEEEHHWLGSDAFFITVAFVNVELLPLGAGLIDRLPSAPVVTGKGPAWWVASELLAEQCRTGTHLQNSG